MIGRCPSSISIRLKLHMLTSKAFDTVSHNKLFMRLASYGIAGSLLQWLQQFFVNALTKPGLDMLCRLQHSWSVVWFKAAA